MRMICNCFCVMILITAMALLAGSPVPSSASVHVSLQPSASYVEPDSVFKVFIYVDTAGSEFNGYDARIVWNPELLAYVSCQPESLFSQHNQWWVPQVGHGEISISHVIMQGGIYETGPGALSSITFRADQLGDCPVAFDEAVFYRAGFLVQPVYTTDAIVHVVDPTSGIRSVERAQDFGLRVLPNPISEDTWIQTELAAGAAAKVWLYDASGRYIDSVFMDGIGSSPWPLESLTRGDVLPAGVYFLVVQSKGMTASTRVVQAR